MTEISTPLNAPAELDLDIVRCAVNLARHRQIPRLALLKQELRKHFPGQDAAIDASLAFWARHARAHTC